MQQVGTSFQPPIVSSPSSECSTSQPALYAAHRARLLFGQYRSGQANDPDIYTASVALILANYPDETIRYVTDPVTGIAANPPTDWDGLPSTAQVKAACEAHYGPVLRARERELHRQAQLNERKLLDGPRAPRPSYEEIQADLAARGLYIGGAKPVTMGDPEAFRKELGVSDEEWAKLPNAPRRP